MKAVLLTIKLMVWVFYGLGGSATSPGMDTLAIMLKSLPGVQVIGPNYWDSWPQVAADLEAAPKGVAKALVGYSCGAASGPDAAATASGVPVALLAGIQASVYCPPALLGPNVKLAQETYNPNWFETLGLGWAQYQPGPGFNPSHLTLIQRPDLHPYADLDPNALSDIYLAVKSLLNAHARDSFALSKGASVPGAINRVVRYNGQPLY